MEYRLTRLGKLWVFLSLVAAILACSGFYLPYWIKGKLPGDVNAYFGSFRRCNYPQVNGNITKIVQICARYSRYEDIPSGWWQASTILVGVGGGLSLLVAVACLDGLALHRLATPGAVRTSGLLQISAGIMMASGCVVYPMGWDNREVKDACGPSANVYSIGECELCWSALYLGLSMILLLFSFLLTLAPNLTEEKRSPKYNYCC